MQPAMGPAPKGDHTMALVKDKTKLAVAAVKNEETQVNESSRPAHKAKQRTRRLMMH